MVSKGSVLDAGQEGHLEAFLLNLKSKFADSPQQQTAYFLFSFPTMPFLSTPAKELGKGWQREGQTHRGVGHNVT